MQSDIKVVTYRYYSLIFFITSYYFTHHFKSIKVYHRKQNCDGTEISHNHYEHQL
jgi:hypothetical protein